MLCRQQMCQRRMPWEAAWHHCTRSRLGMDGTQSPRLTLPRSQRYMACTDSLHLVRMCPASKRRGGSLVWGYRTATGHKNTRNRMCMRGNARLAWQTNTVMPHRTTQHWQLKRRDARGPSWARLHADGSVITAARIEMREGRLRVMQVGTRTRYCRTAVWFRFRSLHC